MPKSGLTRMIANSFRFPAKFSHTLFALYLLYGASAAFADSAPNMSGMFYDPSHNGEGFVVEMLSADQALVYWFSYDAQGRQRWFIGEGTADATGITVPEWLSTRGGIFGVDFDPAAVELIPSGSARFQYSGCHSMSVDYQVDGIAGRQDLSRLTRVADLDCDGLHSHYSGLTGSFFDPARAGEGIVMQVYAHGEVLLVWFTYNLQGEQSWIIGTGAVNGIDVTFENSLTTRGGRFGPEFNPADVERIPWGDIRLDVQCHSLKLFYNALDGEQGSGQLNMVRLTSLSGLSCDAGTIYVTEALSCGEQSRSRLTAETLNERTARPITFNLDYGPARECAPAHDALNGHFKFDYSAMQASDPNILRADYTIGLFPQVEVDFVTVGDFLVPVQPQVLVDSGGSAFNIVFSNGRIWSEPGDGNQSRAGLPFTLSGKQWNEAKNGMMTFLFDGQDISEIHYQITQETVPWNRHDHWGVANAKFTPGVHEDAHAVEQEFRRDLATRLPQRPINQLQQSHPGALADFNRALQSHEVSQAGIIMDSVLYLQPAETRYGNYPWPEEMRHGAFSVTKTAAGLLLMLRLAEKYGASVFDERIVDHVAVSATHDGWATVTFEDALSMATGIGDRFPNPDLDVTFADENDVSNPTWNEFNMASSMEGRLDAAFRYGNYPWPPGEVMRYSSVHTVVLAEALSHYLKEREGDTADLLEFLNREVYQPLGIRWLPAMRIRYLDGRRGLTPLGWGLLPSAHDMARIVALLQNHGVSNGQQILHRQRTIEALRSNGSKALRSKGVQAQLDTGNWVPVSYRDAFWSFPAQSGCDRFASVMQGFGGNSVALMPSGISLFRFADQNVYDDGALAVTGERLRPSC